MFSELGTEVVVRRNDKITVKQALDLNPSGILISPGPCDPDKARICLDLVRSRQFIKDTATWGLFRASNNWPIFWRKSY